MSHTLILGLGNTLRGDDGVGPAAIQLLQRTGPTPPGVTLLDGGTPGLQMVLLWQEFERVLIVDAVEMGQPPGTWRRFAPDEVQIEGRRALGSGTLHDAGLAEALALAEALRQLPPHLAIYGVQPARLGWDTSLSHAVLAVLPALCRALLEEAVTLPQSGDHSK